MSATRAQSRWLHGQRAVSPERAALDAAVKARREHAAAASSERTARACSDWAYRDAPPALRATRIA